MRTKTYVRIRRLQKITKGFLIITLLILGVLIKLKSL